MTQFEAWKAWVASEATIQSRINAVYPQKLPQASSATPLPAVCCVIRQISGASDHITHQGVSDWHRTRTEITIWEKVYKDAEQVLLLIRSKIHNFDGFLGGSSNCRFQVIELRGPRSVDDPESRYIGMQLDVIGMMDLTTLS